MKIGFISTRLAGNDGVSLETAKWAVVMQRLGHEIFYCAGELDKDGPPGLLVPEMHFATEENLWIREHAYGTTEAHPELTARIEKQRTVIEKKIGEHMSGADVTIHVEPCRKHDCPGRALCPAQSVRHASKDHDEEWWQPETEQSSLAPREKQ